MGANGYIANWTWCCVTSISIGSHRKTDYTRSAFCSSRPLSRPEVSAVGSLPPEDPDAWASTIAALAAAPQPTARLRAGIRPPRTMDDVARDMAELYRTLLADGRG